MAEAACPARATAIRALRILIADDSRVARTLLQQQLRTLGHIPASASDGREAALAASAGTYDAVLLDAQMPALDGYRAVQEIRAAERAAARPPVPIFILTGQERGHAEQSAAEAGASGVLVKPVGLEHLRALLLPLSASAALSGALPAAAGPEAEILTALDQLRRLTRKDTAFIEHLIETFLTDATHHLAAIDAAVEARRPQQAAYAAHTLKSAAASFRASAMARACEQILSAAQAGELDAIPAALAELRIEFARAQAVLKDGVARSNAKGRE